MKKIETKIILLSLFNTFVLVLLLGAISLSLIIGTQNASLAVMEKSMRDSFDNLISTQVQNATSILQQYSDKVDKGEMTLEEAKKAAADMIREIRYGENGYFWIDTTEGVNVVLYGSKTEGTNRYEAQDSNGTYYIKEILKNGMQEGGGFSDYHFPKEGQTDPLPKRSYSLEFKPFGWVIGTGNYTDDIDAVINAKKVEMRSQISRQITILGVMSLLVGIIFVMVSVFVGKKISKPIKEASKIIEQISKGDLTVDMPSKYQKYKDEIGLISRSLQQMITTLRSMVQDIVTESNKSMEAVLEVDTNIDMLKGQIDEVASTTEEISAGMEETAASSEEMNATAVEIENAANSIALKAQDGARTVEEIRERASTLREKVLSSQDNAMNILEEAKLALEKAIEESKSVEQITALSNAILQITSQTNLLALNAAIEAARAGEAGRGFAVVAGEIGKLAESSGSTAMEIQEIIKTVQNSVNNLSSTSNKLMEFVSSDVKEDYGLMLEATDKYQNDAENVSDIITDFSATSEELLASIQNMMKAIEEIASATNEGASGITNVAENTAIIADKVTGIAEQTEEVKIGKEKLMKAVERFKLQ
ncbi:methyl-accepting chemotaxis protein [Defluviitalea saccharophila]|uniref:Methyl-accepting chemotaxis protein n=1 Tax=Defluviitalea saccharophila TaxID=879970 RepID=A0ABZ2Y2J7_9FIRM